jgi:thiamine biosynthesis lipoprotein
VTEARDLVRHRVEIHVWGMTAAVTVTDPAGLPAAERVLRRELAAVDAACSRFRPDSELSRLHAMAGSPVRVGPVLAAALTVSLRAAELTDGVVDPTVGAAVAALGYTVDIAALAPDGPAPTEPPRPAPGWWRVGWDATSSEVLLPRGVRLDLGATAKALAADRIATAAAADAGCGVLADLGGDLRAAGRPPDGGWRLGVAADHDAEQTDLVVTLDGGGLATSGTTRRRRRRGGRECHHIVDPRTGDVPESRWRSATVAAASCVDANTASTAGIVLGEHAQVWLEQCGLPARLVDLHGRVATTAGWGISCWGISCWGISGGEI